MNLSEYEQGGRALYADFARAVASILQAAIAEHDDLHLQNIQQRAKEPASLRVKLDKSGAAASADIELSAKDLAGCRLIFYTNGDVYRFGQSGLLQNNFDVDYGRSKIHYPDSNEDGAEFFISENWVVTLSEARCALPEYRRFAGLRCEIQVQTILDHAWAEMAHDTIYKPMTDIGFGAAKVEAMRKRLRKVMQDFLQPAGYAFDKIASDYSQLLAGKTMFDSDALGLIRACSDRNQLSETIDQFANYVLPNYDDYISVAPDIMDALADAAVRAPKMPDVPRSSYYREFPGIRAEEVIAKICRILEGGQLLYASPAQMFGALIAMQLAAARQEEKKPVDQLITRFARYDRHAWQQVGPGVQQLIVDRVEALDDAALVAAASCITLMLKEVLSSEVTGTTWQVDSVTLHRGAIAASSQVGAVRRKALHQLKRLHNLLDDSTARTAARRAMLTAGEIPHGPSYTEHLCKIVLGDLDYTVRFFTSALNTLSLEEKRQVEVDVHQKFFGHHALPPTLSDRPELVAPHAALVEAIIACRAELESDQELGRYRLLVGHDSVTPIMWSKPCFDFQAASVERSAGIDALVETVDAKSADDWLERLERFVVNPSEDRATFIGLQEFIKKLAAAQPAILLSWMPQLSDRLAKWLPAMLHGLSESGHSDAIGPILDKWVDEGKHLSAIAWYLQFAEGFRFNLLVTLTDRALKEKEDQALHNAATAAARQSTKHPAGLYDSVFLPAVTALSSRGLFGWAGEWLNWNELGLLRGLTAEQVAPLVGLLVGVPSLGFGGEQILTAIAGEHVSAVIDLIGQRFERHRETGSPKYEALPYSLGSLRDPLKAAPSHVVAAARRWCDVDPSFSQFHGGHLIAQLFPQLEAPVDELLGEQVETGRDGILFVLSVLRAFEGRKLVHPLLRKVVKHLPDDDELLQTVSIVIESSGVLTGEYGSVKAHEERKALVLEWQSDESEAVQSFAARFVKSADNQLAMERRRADRSVALRKIAYED